MRVGVFPDARPPYVVQCTCTRLQRSFFPVSVNFAAFVETIVKVVQFVCRLVWSLNSQTQGSFGEGDETVSWIILLPEVPPTTFSPDPAPHGFYGFRIHRTPGH